MNDVDKLFSEKPRLSQSIVGLGGACDGVAGEGGVGGELGVAAVFLGSAAKAQIVKMIEDHMTNTVRSSCFRREGSRFGEVLCTRRILRFASYCCYVVMHRDREGE